MVVSNIDESVVYAELKGVNPNDIKKESKMYQIMLYNLNIIIAVGGQKNTSKNISYFPIYLVKNNGNVIQIGLYEILTNKIHKYMASKSHQRLLKDSFTLGLLLVSYAKVLLGLHRHMRSSIPI